MGWERVPGQDRAVALLRADVASGRVAHAYLFGGAAGPAPREAALAFGAALVCSDAGCGRCEPCLRVYRRAHPDVEVIEPPGMQLLVDQVRDAIVTASRRPTVAPRRVIVVDQADRMNPNAQNAFLKALEEAPATTVIVLVAPTPEALLPTVRSRCREIVFQPLSERQVEAILLSDGIPATEAKTWARIGGSLERARALAADADVRDRRRTLSEYVLAPGRDPGESLEAAEWLASQTRAVRDRVASDAKAGLEEWREWYRESKRSAEDRIRREQRRAETDALDACLDDATSLLRDLLALAADGNASVLNTDLRPALAARARTIGPSGLGRVLDCLTELETARRRLRTNANVLLTLERVFLTVHERLG